MNELTTVTTADTRFGKLRSVTLDHQVWFVAKDVCDALGIRNVTQATENICSTDVIDFKVPGQRGRPSKLVSESGLVCTEATRVVVSKSSCPT